LAETNRLRQENADLGKQVNRLIKAESKLYEYQEELDSQLKGYKDLYDLERNLSATPDILKIFAHTVQYVIYNLGYERALLFEWAEDIGSYQVGALDGYYDEQEKAAVAAISIAQEEPWLQPLQADREFLLCAAGSDDSDLLAYRAKLLLDEYLIYPLGHSERPLALLAVGNSAENAELYRRINDNQETLLGMGNLVGLLSSAVENYHLYADIKQALEQEKAAEAKYRGIFENSLEGIFQISTAGKFISCNPALATILGYASPLELIETVTDIERQLYVDPRRHQELLAHISRGVDVKNFELELYRKGGCSRWVLLSAHPVFDTEGTILYVDGMILDITERKQSEEAVRQLNQELEQRVLERTSELKSANDELMMTQTRLLQQEKMASIGQLAAGVAHEINNPMGFILSNLRSLGKYADKLCRFLEKQTTVVDKLVLNSTLTQLAEELGQERKALKIDFILDDIPSLIDESLDGAERVKKIVQNLKSFSRLDESELQLADINECLESTINIAWNEIKYNATLEKDFGDIPHIKCNPGHLNQVFINLLVNASQAMVTPGEIRVKTASDSDTVFVSISDSGMGIPADKLSRIFDPFFTTKEVGKGTGLGLSIVYDIIKSHKGEIRVESELGKGTSFTVSLPIL